MPFQVDGRRAMPPVPDVVNTRLRRDEKWDCLATLIMAEA